jgi:hypothetical protein
MHIPWRPHGRVLPQFASNYGAHREAQRMKQNTNPRGTFVDACIRRTLPAFS